MDDREEFYKARREKISLLANSEKLQRVVSDFIESSAPLQYVYNFDWLGLPIIQFPQDIVALQELIWKVKPDVIIETGVARGGSLILSASILHLLNAGGKVIGIDIDIREHNRKAIMEHPLASHVRLIQGSSVEPETLAQVRNYIEASQKVLVILDSDHTHEHVCKELEFYSPFVGKDSYIVVMDTGIEDASENISKGHSWGKGNNPKTAVREFLKKNDRFEIDKEISNKLLITAAPDGFLRCIKD